MSCAADSGNKVLIAQKQFAYFIRGGEFEFFACKKLNY